MVGIVSLAIIVPLMAGCGSESKTSKQDVVTTDTTVDESEGTMTDEERAIVNAKRPTFTMEKPATYPTFNSITNNPVMGDERDFVRIVEKGSGGTFNSHQEIEAGKEYVVSIYIHNNASSTFNDKAHDYSGVARDVRVISYFPTELAAGVEGKVDGMVISSNAKPQKVWDEAYITPKEDVKISYVAGTARIQNDWDADGTVLSDKLFTKEGVFIGLNELNGVILGCEAYSSLIFYTLKVEAAK